MATGDVYKPLFELGQIYATQGVLDEMELRELNPASYIARHVTGDWGDLCDEDKIANNMALLSGSRILSAYKLDDTTKIWVITESDRSSSTVLLPSEY